MPEPDDQMQSVWQLLEERIDYRFSDRSLLVQALTHRSFANESRGPGMTDNERLEFLGDAVLGLVIGHHLFATHIHAAEGELSRVRAELVKAPSLARLAAGLSLGDCLLLGRGEARSGGRDKENLLADSLEAIVGAVFVDGGYAAATAVVGKLFTPILTGAGNAASQDYKTRLQELLQGRQQLLPEYVLTATHGPDHQRCYQVEVLVAGNVLGRGEGTTKKRAEQDAAHHALARLETQGAN